MAMNNGKHNDTKLILRTDLIHAMRREGIPDVVAGRVLGISRERVRQIAGNRIDDPQTLWVGYTVQDARKFIEDVKSGEYNMSTLAGIHGYKSVSSVLQLMRELGLEDEYRRARKEAAENALKRRLAAFAAHWKKISGTNEYQTCDLLAYDHSLYTLAVRTGWLAEWSRELGLVYTTGERRRAGEGKWAKYRTPKLEPKFERRRKV